MGHEAHVRAPGPDARKRCVAGTESRACGAIASQSNDCKRAHKSANTSAEQGRIQEGQSVGHGPLV